MKCFILTILVLLAYLTLFVELSTSRGKRNDDLKLRITQAKQLSRKYDRKFKKLYNRQSNALWNYLTNLTEENQKIADKMSLKLEEAMIDFVDKARKINTEGFPSKLKRIIEMLQTTVISRDPKTRKEAIKLWSTMEKIYGEAQARLPNGTYLENYEDAVVEFFQNERDYDVLGYVWQSWHNVSGKRLKSSYEKLVTALNKQANENGYKDFGYHEWFTDFELPDFDSKVLDIYYQLKPFYTQLHAYVRHKLSRVYPGRFSAHGLIPAHVFGNVWAQQWQAIFDLVIPFPESKKLDLTKNLEKLHAQGKINVKNFFLIAEEFFTSLGLYSMTEDFWKKSIYTKQNNTTMQCHGSAHDFYNNKDYRILMCTKMNFEDFTTVHHEMGHIEYYMAYEGQPLVFMSGSNSGFHEAIGDTIALAVTTKTHLQKIGLIPYSSDEEDEGSTINQLMFKAMEKIAFLPFALVVDNWRWHVFNGSITPKNYNSVWWKMHAQFRGVKPPVTRCDDDFDPGAKYHVATNIPYIRYFFSFIVQFQFYKAMCDESKWEGPLHLCDFYQSKEAGLKLEKMLQLGSSKRWPFALEVLTGERDLNVGPLLEYFDPLIKWITKYNEENDVPVGW